MELRRATLSDQEIELVVFHRRIELFFKRGQQTMNLVDEEHVAFLKVGQQGGDVAGFLDRRAGSGFEFGAHLVGDDVGESGFAETRWPSQQHVIERFATMARRLSCRRAGFP